MFNFNKKKNKSAENYFYKYIYRDIDISVIKYNKYDDICY